jgi:hypothetical protein
MPETRRPPKPQEGIRIVVEDNDLAAIADHESEETLRSTQPKELAPADCRQAAGANDVRGRVTEEVWRLARGRKPL